VFIQVINFRTSKVDEGRKLADEFRTRTEGKRTVRRGFLTQDREDKNNLFNIVLFDSYEAAMQNSELPETQELAGKLAALCDGPPSFYNLEVLEEFA
jgi:hypothetical protein